VSRPFAIQRNLSLGDEYRTTVFELQLDAVDSKETAVTVALALREAVASRLGVEASEMGVAAAQTLNRNGQPRWTSVVFDTAAGGAGFASQIADDPASVIADAAQVLDCQRAGACGDTSAKRICPNCVLRPEVQHLHEQSDRRAAHAVLLEAAHRLALPEEFSIFGAGSKYLPHSLPDALRRHLYNTGADALVIRAQGSIADWELDLWEMGSVLLRFPDVAKKALVLIDPSALDAATPMEKVELALWANKHGSRLAIAPGNWPSATAIIATKDSQSRHWGAKHVDLIPGSEWGTSDGPAVFFDGPAWNTLVAPIDAIAWLSEPGKSSIAIVTRELDGNVNAFGAKFRDLVGTLNPKLGGQQPLELAKVKVSDRYIFSPLAVRLYAEIFAAFSKQIPEIEVVTRGSKFQDNRSPFRITHDWEHTPDRDDVLEACLRTIAGRVVLTTPREVPHRRSIQFELRSGEILEVVLDQGVGSWGPIVAPKFNFMQSARHQADDLMNAHFMIQCARGGTFLGVL
tara:strand:- start:241 stop:1788 length:1548 start_codon:yes stop_codon:yes gene_type:complete